MMSDEQPDQAVREPSAMDTLIQSRKELLQAKIINVTVDFVVKELKKLKFD